MGCPQAEGTLSLAAGVMPEAARGPAVRHLEICSECAASFASISRGSIGDSPATVEVAAADLFDCQMAVDTQTRPEPEPEPATPVLPRGSPLGRYVLLDLLGEGGMAQVYSAVDPELGRKVAIKLVRARATSSGSSATEGQARLLREARAMALLSHPNVAPVYDAGTVEGRVFLAMELVDGQTLKRWLKERPRRWPEIVEAFRQAGAGLAAAHRVGLVHRDFKPQNVVIGSDGRARVLDFGLARAESDGDGFAPLSGSPRANPGLLEDSGSQPQFSQSITRAGSVVGTPGYMAPEQYRHQPFDARTDQFSFCVALYEALYGERPFAGRSFEELSRAVTTGTLRPEPPGSRVPQWLRRIALRGLSTDPDARFPSMDALLDALGRDPAMARRRWLVVGAGALLTSSFLAGLAWYQQRQQRQCSGAQEKLVGVWDEGRKLAVEQAFLDTKAPFAAHAWGALEQSLDAYARTWVQQHTDACEATRFRGEQSEAVLTLRMSCLEDRRKELRALTDVLSHADQKSVEQATSAPAVLGALGHCEDVTTLASRAPLPSDPEARAQVDRSKELVGQARALWAAGQLIPGMALARQAVEEANASRYTPVQAQAMLLLTDFQGDAQEMENARSSAFEAHRLGEASGDDEVRFSAMLSLVESNARRPEALAEGQACVQFAAAMLPRLPDPVASEAKLLLHAGILLQAYGKHAEAAEQVTQGLALARQAQDAQLQSHHLRILGNLYYEMGRTREALELHQESLRLHRSELGSIHPFIAYDLNNIANTYIDLGMYAEAIEALLTSVDIKEQLLGPEHPSLGSSLMNLGDSYRLVHRLDEAERYLSRGLVIFRKTEHRELPWGLSAMGQLREEQHRLDEALQLFGEALERAKKKGPGGVADQFAALLGSGRVHWKKRELPAAHEALAAAETLATSYAYAQKSDLSQIRLLLAEVRWARGERASAQASATQALADLDGAEENTGEQRAAVRAWLDGHR